jgi:hypothetical protein
MMKGRITTTDQKIYDALSRLRHEREVVIEKPIEYKVLDRILSNNENIVAVSNGKNIILKKMTDVKFDVYLKKIW